MTWLAAEGAVVSKPIFHSPDYDLIAELHGRLVRVQVKTSVAWHENRLAVALCTRGGNRSWTGVIKRIDASRCDVVFIHVGDGRRWFIPVGALGGGSGVLLGDPKYVEFEIEPGVPLQPRTASLDSAPPWRDSRAVKGDAL